MMRPLLALCLLCTPALADPVVAPRATTDQPRVVQAAPVVDPVPAATPAPESVDPVLARLNALDAALASLQKQSGAPVGIPPSFWNTTAGQVLGVTLSVATIVTSAAASAASVYAAVK